MQDRYKPPPQDAAEFRAPRSWEDTLGSPLPPEIDTPEKRLSALVNIVQNGAQTLEVLSMSSEFVHYGRINKAMNEQTDFPNVVTNATTLRHLQLCIEPVGAAAKSDLDDKMWALTPFGLMSRPTLIFAWQKILDHGIQSMDLFGQISQGARGSNGSWQTTAAMNRTVILSTIPDHDDVRVADLVKAAKLSSNNISRHCDQLDKAGFLTKRSTSPNEGQSYSYFTLTEQGEKIDAWPVYISSQGYALRTDSTRVFEAIRVLNQRDIPVTSDNISTYIDQKYGQGQKDRKQRVAHIATHLTKIGILKYVDFHSAEQSEVLLTERGRYAVHNILLPLMLWSEDPYAVEEINEIAKILWKNEHAYNGLFQLIAENFVSGSHNKNADLQKREDDVLKLIRAESGKLTSSDIARRLRFSPPTIRKAVIKLARDGVVKLQKAEIGNRILLFAVDVTEDS